MAEDFGFFDYQPSSGAKLPDLILDLLESAEEAVGPVDGVVLPELAISESDYDSVRSAALTRATFVVSGVHQPPDRRRDPGAFGKNQLRFDIKWMPGLVVEIDSQPKHHRWVLDAGQIIQYGLGGNLDPTVRWWENIEIGARQLNFVALESWLSVCVLICEDLARQDPVADLIRSVGPNLVIALLMDGPQLATRWAARYATVLADDPGSSVLTLTSLGMAGLCRPPGKEPSRVVALWKDPLRPDPVQVELPKDHKGVVLSLSLQRLEEFTADGRSDRGHTGCPILSGIHPVAPIERRS